MHAAGIVHRDLKPNNIMLERGEERLSVSIMDFGLARLYAAEASMLTAGVIAGTPDYMAPELFFGQPPTEASDLFALGVVLHRIFTGDRPGRSKTGVLYPAASLRCGQTPAWMAEVVEGLLSADPAERRRAFANLPSDTKSGTPATQPARSTPRLWSGMGYAAVGVAVVMAIAIWLTPARVSGPLDSTQITSTEEAKQGPLFTDGARLYFYSRGAPAETAAVGGFSVPMHIFDPAFRLLDISADGSKALALRKDLNDETDRGTLWSESMLGGTPQKLSDHLAQFGCWSPDGRSVVFADQQTLYRMDASGANLAKLWDAPRSIRDFSFSPDGRRLSASLYLGNAIGDNSRLWELQADGENAHPLQFDGSSNMGQFGGQWTPDGSHFVFRSSHNGRPQVYELVRPPWFEFWKKPTAVRITENQLDIQGLTPERNSKGLFILGRPDQGAMQALDVKTGKFVPYLDGLSAFNFVISPDRQWMAYTEYPSRYLWKSRLDGSERSQLTSSPASMQQWSPDGKWLTYTDWKNFYVVSADGGAPQNLSPKSADGVVPVMPSWLADGRSIAWSYFPFPDRPLTGIHVIDLASRKVSVMPGSQGYYAPSWSPDGKYLVASAQNPSRMVLYTAATKTWRDLHLFDVEWGLWIWSTDSKSVHMALVRKGATGIFRLTVPDGAWSRVSGLDGVTTEDGGTPPSLTPDGRPAFMSHTGVVQIYSLSWKSD